jgi:hypothetical protein
MIKALQAFAILFAIFFFGIQAFRALSGKEKWEIAKLLTYSILCAVAAIIVLSVIVVVF